MAFGTPHLEIRRPSPTTVEFKVTTQPRRAGWTGWALTAAVVVLRVLLAAGVAVALWGWARSQPWAGVEGMRATGGSGSSSGSGDGSHSDPEGALLDALAGMLLAAAASTPAWLLLPLCAAGAWASVVRVHTSESLLVLRGLGIQTSSTGATYLGELGSALGFAWWTLTSPWALLRAVGGGGGGVAAGMVGGSGGGDGVGGAGVAAGRGGGGGGCIGGDDDYEPSPAATTRFIPTAKLQDLLVNEAFFGFEVRYYLVAVVVGTTGGAAGWSADGVDGGISSRSSSMNNNSYGSSNGNGNGIGWGDAGFGVRADGDYHSGSSSYPAQNGNNSSSANGGGGGGVDGEGGSSQGQLADGDDEDHVVVVFPQLLPGLDIVRTVWREARACLYEAEEEKT